jgi:N-dimethylarginine dimethylaminohydrolase
MNKVLLCPPDYFDIEYEINAWMHENNQVDTELARHEWQSLVEIYSKKLNWDVSLVEPVKGQPDMVFATDCCLINSDKIFLSNFRYPERRAETQFYEKWFRDNGYTDLKTAQHKFEGGGDSLICGDRILAGYGFRSDIESHHELNQYFDMEVISLRLINPYFFHLDTCLTVLSKEALAFYPNAFDKDSQEKLRRLFPGIIEASAEEANGFGLNAVSDGHTVITSDHSASLLQKYRGRGFEVIATPVLEFRKSGGGVKCLTLSLSS